MRKEGNIKVHQVGANNGFVHEGNLMQIQEVLQALLGRSQILTFMELEKIVVQLARVHF